jgi:hypothetical protein
MLMSSNTSIFFLFTKHIFLSNFKPLGLISLMTPICQSRILIFFISPKHLCHQILPLGTSTHNSYCLDIWSLSIKISFNKNYE